MKNRNRHLLDPFLFCPKCGCSHFEIHTIKSKQCEKCGFIYFLNPSAAVAAFIRNEQGELLLCERAKEPQKGTLDLPGGFVDGNETAEEAILREIKEELNLVPTRLTYLFSFPNFYYYSDFEIPTLDLFFECSVSDFSQLKAADDVALAQFVLLNEIDENLIGLDSIRKAVVYYKSERSKIDI